MTTHDDPTLHPEPDRDLDETLRRALDPDPATVDRLVRRALDESEGRAAEPVAPFSGWGRRWVPSMALVALLLLVLLFGIPFDRVPPSQEAGPIADLPASPTPDSPLARAQAPVEAPIGAPTGGAALKISNVGGVVTVSSLGGSHFIALPGDDS